MIINILFIASSRGIDYQCHCLFHGLNCLEGVTVYTLNDQPFMYTDYPHPERNKLYGMGFSISCRLSPIKRHLQDKNTIINNIRAHYYDFIIYGEMNRCLDLWEYSTSYYRKSEIICVEGSDFMHPFLSTKLKWGSMLLKPFLFDKALQADELVKKSVKAYDLCKNKGTIFKRELHKKYVGDCLPINFAIPKENIVCSRTEKNRRMAFIIPGKADTYIYKTEKDYYKGYQDAYWGTTFKKAGWDCLRHYEILCNGCIPYFPDIKKCPNTIMVPFPKNIIEYTNLLYDNGVEGGRELDCYIDLLLDYTRTYLTTEALAKYVLSIVI